jgi:hypothetical protein
MGLDQDGAQWAEVVGKTKKAEVELYFHLVGWK